MAEFKTSAAGETEAQWRQFMSYLFAQQGSIGISTSGVLAGLVVSQTTTASVSVSIAVGAAVVQDTIINGVSPLISNAAKTLDILTANPVGATPRNDIVVFDAATSSIHSITGAPNATPSDPTIPATMVPLGRLRHAANATTVPGAVIDDLRVNTGVKGDLGRILGVYSGAFDPNLPPSGIAGSTSHVWGITPQNIGWVDIADPGRPYRVQLNCAAEMGAEDSVSRWDFAAVAAGNTFGRIVVLNSQATWRQLISWPSPVMSGPQRVNLQAYRVIGTGVGAITPYNQHFVVTVFAA